MVNAVTRRYLGLDSNLIFVYSMGSESEKFNRKVCEAL